MNRVTFLVAAGSLTGATIGFIFYVRRQDQRTRDAARETYRLEPPADLSLDQITAFTRSLTALRPATGWLLGRDTVVFETVRQDGRTQLRVRIPKSRADRVLVQLRGLVPGLRTVYVKPPAIPQVNWVRELRLATTADPLRTDQAEAFSSSVLHALGAATDDEDLIYQVVAYSFGTLASLPTSRSHGLTIGPRWLQALAGAISLRRLSRQPSAPAHHRTKLGEPVFGLAIRVGGRSATRARSQQLVSHVVGTIHQLDRPGTVFITRRRPQRWAQRQLTSAATPTTHAPVHANAHELATLIAWLGVPGVPGLQLAGGRDFPPARELPSSGYVLGRATYPGMERAIAISRTDALMHTLVTGPTGSGKSTVLLGRLKQSADAGEAVILIDPNGDLATDFINCLPADRIGDLIYLNPADERAVALNPLDCAPEDAELVADQVLELIRDRSGSWGVQIDETLKATLVLLAASPDMTLTEVPAVLLNESFRAHLVSRLDPTFAATLGEFFARFEGRSAAQQDQDAAAVLNKVSPLIDRRAIRAMLGQAEPTWTMRNVIDGRQVLVVSLPGGVIGPVAADLIGGMVAQMVWNAALGRITAERAARRPISLVIDELPRFVRGNANLADMLARARAQGLGLTGAVQHLEQVAPALRSALLSEARNKIVLQPAAEDARQLAHHMLGVSREDLLGLAPRTAMASLTVQGRVTAPVTIATAPPPRPTGHGAVARASSRQRFGRDRHDVELAIQHRRQRGAGNGPRRTRRLP